MVCSECMKKYSFLRVYELSHANQDNEPSQANEQGQPHQAHKEGQSHLANEQGPPIPPSKVEEDTLDGKKVSSPSPQADGKKAGGCVLKERVSDAALSSTGVAFFAEDWRSKLCKCQYCMVRVLCSSSCMSKRVNCSLAVCGAVSVQLDVHTQITLHCGMLLCSLVLCCLRTGPLHCF